MPFTVSRTGNRESPARRQAAWAGENREAGFVLFRRRVIHGIGAFLCLDDPAAAHGLVGADQRAIDIALDADVLQLRIEEFALGIEHIDIGRVAFVIAQLGETRIVGERRDAPALGHQFLARFLHAHQRVIHLAEGALNRLQIAD